MAFLRFQNALADTADLGTFQLSLSAVNGSELGRVYLVGTSGKTFKASSSPGIDNILVSFTDTTGGLAAADVKLATSEAGLTSAVAGVGLSLGTEIIITAGNTGHPEIWVEMTDASGVTGTQANLALSVNDCDSSDTV
ncbi:MAG: hypothetical protein KAH03_06240 [Cocleimonas sp.]|nr:hypothetical protein [Cocleimonas sp.]